MLDERFAFGYNIIGCAGTAKKASKRSLKFAPSEVKIMFFDQSGFYANAFLATRLTWESEKVSVKPRPYHSLSLRLSGGGKVAFNGRVYELNPGDLIYMPAGYGYDADYTATEMLCLHFTAKFDREPGEVEYFNCSNKVLELFNKGVATYAEKKDGYALMLNSIFYEILSALSVNAEREDDLLLHALSFISDNYGDPELKLDKICRFVGASEATLRRRFYDRFLLSPIDYVINLRLDKACELIAAEGCTVAAAAEKCGFSDPKYLSRLMKKRRGISPSSLKTPIV